MTLQQEQINTSMTAHELHKDIAVPPPPPKFTQSSRAVFTNVGVRVHSKVTNAHVLPQLASLFENMLVADSDTEGRKKKKQYTTICLHSVSDGTEGLVTRIYNVLSTAHCLSTARFHVTGTVSIDALHSSLS